MSPINGSPQGRTEESWMQFMSEHTEQQTRLLARIDHNLSTLKTIAIVVIVLAVAGGVVSLLSNTYQ